MAGSVGIESGKTMIADAMSCPRLCSYTFQPRILVRWYSAETE